MGLKILEPIEINGMRIKNRLGFALLLNMPCAESCAADEKTVRWFEERAKGGLGFILTGAANPIQPPFPSDTLGLWNEEHVKGLSAVVDAVHEHGSAIGVQLAMAGPMAGFAPSPDHLPDAPVRGHPLRELQGKVPEVYRVGDRVNLDDDVDQTANIKGAIWTANEVSRAI